MNNQDLFREIAMTKHPGDIADQEVNPLLVTGELFEEVATGPDMAPWEAMSSYEEKCVAFKVELEEMRKRFTPFMDNYLPTMAHSMTVTSLEEFDFRYKQDENWEKVRIPDYRGPADEKGKWQAYYKTAFSVKEANQKIGRAHV